ncbi:protein of unknown function [Rhodovastum atsumiense]|nr:protein of unknown function [Rhodovastum atsumiense]
MPGRHRQRPAQGGRTADHVPPRGAAAPPRQRCPPPGRARLKPRAATGASAGRRSTPRAQPQGGSARRHPRRSSIEGGNLPTGPTDQFINILYMMASIDNALIRQGYDRTRLACVFVRYDTVYIDAIWLLFIPALWRILVVLKYQDEVSHFTCPPSKTAHSAPARRGHPGLGILP